MRASKKKISVSIDQGLVEWIDKRVEDFTFQSRSDGLEKGILLLQKENEKKQKT